jgi:cell division protein FtsB
MEIEKTYPELLEMGKNARTALAEMLKLSHEQVASQKAQIAELNVVVSYLDAKITSASNCHERAIPFLLSEALERTHLDFHRESLKDVNHNLVPIVSDIDKLQDAYQTLAQEDDKKSDRIKELEEKSIEAWLTEEGEKHYPESVDSKWERFAYENAKRSASEFCKRKSKWAGNNGLKEQL